LLFDRSPLSIVRGEDPVLLALLRV